MNIAGRILKLFGWTMDFTVPNYPKCIYCVAPHTSNWDFVLGELAIHAAGRKAGFLMKSSWFFFPLGSMLKGIGGVPVVRKNKKISLVEAIIERFNREQRLALAITPEGTRKRVTNWHTGFLRIAYETNVPILLGAIDYASKHITVTEEFQPSGSLDADIRAIKHYYSQFTGKYPEKFSTDDN